MTITTQSLRRQFLALAAVTALGATTASFAAETITMASTTSTQASGLLNYMLPEFKKDSGIEVKVVAVGTGQAIDMAKRGDADVLFVHNKKQEEQFVADGFGLPRQDVMYNDFVLIGPKADPANVAGNDITAALKKIASGNASFISRGDRSGTHSAELRHWDAAGLKDAQGKGYRACGCGMGPALNMASAMNAYVLSDRATWLNFGNPGDLKILVSGDKRLFNQYGVMVVNPTKHPHVNAADAQAFVDWITSTKGQNAIDTYKINGEVLFFANADSR
jgi:tungstate transport system substrate-binding protein